MTLPKLGPFYEYSFEFYVNSLTPVQNIFEIRNNEVDLGTGLWIVPDSKFSFHTFYNNNLHSKGGIAIPIKLKTWMKVEASIISEDGKVNSKICPIII